MHMVAPHLELETIKEIAGIRDPEKRMEILQKTEIPNYRDLYKSINDLKAVV